MSNEQFKTTNETINYNIFNIPLSSDVCNTLFSVLYKNDVE